LLSIDRIGLKVHVMRRERMIFRSLRMTYLEGTLEIMTPSRKHEISNKALPRLLERYPDNMDINLNGL